MRILLVEDNLDLAFALTDALTRVGHAVRLEETMRGAMDALYEGGFECLITDGRFPSYHNWDPPQPWGIDLLRAARHLKVRGILYSGDGALVDQARRMGFPALLKSASVAELLKAVEG